MPLRRELAKLRIGIKGARQLPYVAGTYFLSMTASGRGDDMEK